MRLRQILFGFHGRIRRTTYWLASIGSAVVIFAVGFSGFGAVAGLAIVLERQVGGAAEAVLGVVAALIIGAGFIVYYWTRFALMVKRCHDRNYPGAMSLIALVPLVGFFWALIDLGFIDGTQGPNQYGPSPKGLGETVESIFS